MPEHPVPLAFHTWCVRHMTAWSDTISLLMMMVMMVMIDCHCIVWTVSYGRRLFLLMVNFSPFQSAPPYIHGGL
jgi:hypothetical protein